MTRKKGAATVWTVAAMLIAAGASLAEAAETYMHTGARTTQPVGHYELCMRQPGECGMRTAARKPIELTRALWKTLVAVNNSVNTAMTPLTDQEMWGREEVWSYPDGFGDCEDYVLEKRRLLMARGVPAGSLLITVVRQPNGAGHAVLTVKTSRGEFVLDNLEPQVLAWTDTEYTYLKRQSEQDSGVWIAINQGSENAVASVR